MSTNGNLKSAAMPSVEIYTDGGCEPNPGPGGYGVVLLHPRKRAEVSGGFRLTTNNRMEIFGAIDREAAQVSLRQFKQGSGGRPVYEAFANLGRLTAALQDKDLHH